MAQSVAELLFANYPRAFCLDYNARYHCWLSEVFMLSVFCGWTLPWDFHFASSRDAARPVDSVGVDTRNSDRIRFYAGRRLHWIFR